MIFKRVIKSNEEQAIASWTNYINQVRLDNLLKNLQNQNQNFKDAINTLDSTMHQINKSIIEQNRGGTKGMHGFIAEVAECGIGNAREQILGKAPKYVWINDNGPSDFVRDGIEIQQKFVNSGNHLSLFAIKQHYEKYPWFLDGGRKYQIPADHYEKIKMLLSISENQANQMGTKTGEFSLKQWKEVNQFFATGNIKLSDIEPSKVSYKEVQRNQINTTIYNEKGNIKDIDTNIRRDIYNKSKPTFKQGAYISAIAASLEGGTAFITGIIKKKRLGKTISEFTKDDWLEISRDSGIGAIKGGTRGITIYALTNYTATPAAVASSLCTASFGIAEEAYKFRKKLITKEEFLLNSQILCVDVSVSALSSILGHAVIPIPILGAVIGNTIGTFLYEIAKDNLTMKEKLLIADYLKEIQEYSCFLDNEFELYNHQLQREIKNYYKLLGKAFSPDYNIAFQGSIELAVSCGVDEVDILKNEEEIDNYFT